jgi:hypothetical protein
MTLILSCITRDYVFQVSDRRLTWASGPNKGKIAEDNRNKAVVLYNYIAFGYTGLANLPLMKTDEWLVDVLAKLKPYNPARACQVVAQEATAQFRHIPLGRMHKRHAFIAAGWARFAINGPLRPFLCSISNALNDQWRWLNEARDEFIVRVFPLADNKPFEFYSAGADIGPKHDLTVRRRIRSCINKKAGPNAYIRVLAECIRSFSTPQNSVGKSLLAVSLPLAAGQAGGMSMPFDRRLPPDQAACLYIPEGEVDGVLYGPNLVYENMLITSAWVRYGKAVERPAEMPLWERGPLILSKRVGSNKEADPIRPALADDYELSKGWGIVAEARDWPNGVPSPCFMYVGIETEDLPKIERDSRYLIVTSPESLAHALPESEWLGRLQAWLFDADFLRSAVTSFMESLHGLNRGEIANSIRSFFSSGRFPQ